MSKHAALNRKYRLGLCINPYAGIGGALALKGSDGEEIRKQALDAGASKQAMAKTEQALLQIATMFDSIELFTGSGDMGQNLAEKLGIDYTLVHTSKEQQTESKDTIALTKAIAHANVDLLVFAGGDGTARNVFEAIGDSLPVLGIPAGCKIHSGVFAITPRAGGKVLEQVIKGELLSIKSSEVRDIDEVLFRQGKVIAKHYGEMQVPSELNYIQAVKMGGKESDELLLDDISDYVIELMEDEPDTLFVMGSGSTVASVMEKLTLDNTLLGVDIIKNRELIASDVSAAKLLDIIGDNPCKLVATLIGGQGHILGRGNQQLSPAFIRKIGKQNMLILATKNKLKTLGSKGLISDSGDPTLDEELAGPISVISGYKDHSLYFVQS